MDYNQQRRGMQNNGCRQNSNSRRLDNSGTYSNSRYQRSMGPRPGYSNSRPGSPGARPGTGCPESKSVRPNAGLRCPEPTPAPICPCPGPAPDPGPIPRPRPSASCDCSRPSSESGQNLGPDFALAMAYIKWQKWGPLYDPCDALSAGTLFPCLNKPFCAGRCR